MGYFRSMAGLTAHGGLTAIPANVVTTGLLYAGAAGLLLCAPLWPALRRRCARWAVGHGALEVTEVCAALAVLFLCLIAMGAGTHNPFIYYRF
jgi:hypothetical protein